MEKTYANAIAVSVFSIKLHYLLTKKNRKITKHEKDTYSQIMIMLSLIYNIQKSDILNIFNSFQFDNLKENAIKLIHKTKTFPIGLISSLFSIKLHLLLTEKRKKLSKKEDQIYIDILSVLSLIYDIDLKKGNTLGNILRSNQFKKMVDYSIRVLHDG